MPGRKMGATPNVFETMRPRMMAQRTYSMRGMGRCCWVRRMVKTCSRSLPRRPIPKRRATPGSTFRRRVAGETAGGAGLGVGWADMREGEIRLEGDGVDDVEADEGREGEGDDDGDKIYVEAETSAVDVFAGCCLLCGCHDDS